MKSIPRVLQCHGIGQDLLYVMLYRFGGTCGYHKSTLNLESVWHKHSCDTQDDEVKAANNPSVNFADEVKVYVDPAWNWDGSFQDSKSAIKTSSHPNESISSQPPNGNHVPPKRRRCKPTALTDSLVLPRPAPCGCPSTALSLSCTGETEGPDSGAPEHPSSHSDQQWEVPQDRGPAIPWDPDTAAHCERATLVSAPLPPAPLPEQPRQADPAAETELGQLTASGQLSAALRSAASLAGSGTPPSFPALVLLADEAAHRADSTSFERARRLAARLYPASYGRAARLRAGQLELLWRRRLFAPACSLLMRYRSEPVHRQVMTRRFAVCCCLAAQEGVEDALPHIQRAAAALMAQGVPDPLLSAWQHCVLSEQHSFQQAARRLLLHQPDARRQLAPYLLRVLEEAQVAGREDVLRRLLELVLRLGESRLYPLVFGALLDFQCLMEDIRSAQETFKLVGELSIRLPSTVINRYSSLLQRHRLKAPAALLRMKYRQRPPDGSAAPKVPPAPAWWDKW